jgi:hypothetical protein
MQKLTNPVMMVRVARILIISTVLSVLDLFFLHAAVLSLIFILFASVAVLALLVKRSAAKAVPLIAGAILMVSIEYFGSRAINLQISEAASNLRDEVNLRHNVLGDYPLPSDSSLAGRKRFGYPIRYVSAPQSSVGETYVLYDTFNFQRNKLDVRTGHLSMVSQD